MKHIIRSIKYFFYFAFLTTAIVLVLIFIGAVEGGVENIFEDGYNSLWKIAVFFAAIAAVYPKFAFYRRRLDIDADWDRVRNAAAGYFSERGLVIESESSDVLTFRRRSMGARLAKMFEDRITLSRTEEGYVLDGMRKDIIMFATGLETILSE